MIKLFANGCVLILTGMLVFISSCKKDTPATAIDLGYAYFPDQAGKYVIYDVDSIVYDDFQHDTDIYKFLIKEKTESIYTDNSGRPTLRIERYKKTYDPNKSYDSIPWKLKDVWCANLTGSSAEKVEENIRYVKLIFPIEKNKTWNGNSFNILSEWEYKYTDINMPKAYGVLNFDSTLLVMQKNYQDLIQKHYYTEVYAKNVGMIYKEVFDVHSGTINSLPVENRIESGLHMKMQVIAYGTE